MLINIMTKFYRGWVIHHEMWVSAIPVVVFAALKLIRGILNTFRFGRINNNTTMASNGVKTGMIPGRVLVLGVMLLAGGILIRSIKDPIKEIVANSEVPPLARVVSAEPAQSKTHERAAVTRLPNAICCFCGHDFYASWGTNTQCPKCKSVMNAKRAKQAMSEGPINDAYPNVDDLDTRGRTATRYGR